MPITDIIVRLATYDDLAAVLSSVQGVGVGRRLLTALCAHGRVLGCKEAKVPLVMINFDLSLFDIFTGQLSATEYDLVMNSTLGQLPLDE